MNEKLSEIATRILETRGNLVAVRQWMWALTKGPSDRAEFLERTTNGILALELSIIQLERASKDLETLATSKEDGNNG